MHLHFNPQKLAIGIIIFAIVLFIGEAIYGIYKNSKETYIAGSPPKELREKIPAKEVPYEQIKPPAINADDAFLLGSPSSTYGVVFYGDYAKPESNKLLIDIISVLEPYGNLVRLNYRYLPESSDDGHIGYESAVASECSRLFGSHQWLLHHLFLQADPDKLTTGYIRNTIEATTMQPEIIKACQFNTSIRNKISTDINRAKGDGIDVAPFIFVGTQAIPSQSANQETVLNALKTYIRK